MVIASIKLKHNMKIENEEKAWPEANKKGVKIMNKIVYYGLYLL